MNTKEINIRKQWKKNKKQNKIHEGGQFNLCCANQTSRSVTPLRQSDQQSFSKRIQSVKNYVSSAV
jgi:hypothetical protein